MQPHITSGSVRALAMSSAQRFRVLPNVPTVAEAGVPGYVFESWGGFMGPAGMPADLIAKINEAVAYAERDPAMAAQFESNGAIPRQASPQEFGGWIKTSVDKLAQVIKTANIKAD
jgi:tripartite-type tricarboxylate transporter receptor subunit TctC